jgi:hypothetical protein
MRWIARIRLVFSFLACLATGAAAAFDPGARIEVTPPVPDAGTLLRIAIEGSWPDACTPELQDAEIVDRDIVLRATLPAANCAGEAHAYRIDSSKVRPVNLKLRGNGFYRMRFEVQRGAGTAPELHGFRLLYAGNDGNWTPRPEAGFWWPESGGEFDRAGPGMGMQLEAQANTLSLGVTGYDPDGGSNWLFGAGDLVGHVAQVDVNRLQGGAGPFESYRAPESIATAGQVQLEILSPSRINAWFVGPAPEGRGLHVEPVSMVRFRFAQQPAQAWLGPWVVLAETVDAMPARRIEFDTVEHLDEGFVLRDAAGRHELRCTLDKTRRNSPPQACVLAIGEVGAERREVHFTQVGLNEMRGWNSDSGAVVAIKLSR